MSTIDSRKVHSGDYVGQVRLEDLYHAATRAWDDAGHQRGPWRMDVDVAELAKLCGEAIERRAYPGYVLDHEFADDGAGYCRQTVSGGCTGLVRCCRPGPSHRAGGA